MAALAVFGIWPRMAIQAVQRAVGYVGSASVASDGSITANSGILTNASLDAPGVFTLTLNPALVDLASLNFAVTSGLLAGATGGHMLQMLPGALNTLVVRTFDNDDNASSQAFSIAVHRTPTPNPF